MVQLEEAYARATVATVMGTLMYDVFPRTKGALTPLKGCMLGPRDFTCRVRCPGRPMMRPEPEPVQVPLLGIGSMCKSEVLAVESRRRSL